MCIYIITFSYSYRFERKGINATELLFLVFLVFRAQFYIPE